MNRINELQYKIDEIKYDIETKEMEKAGWRNRFKRLKERFCINIVVFLLYLLFLKITVYGNYENNPGYFMIFAFSAVLRPVFFIVGAIYVVMFIVKPMWELFINSNVNVARQFAKKNRIDSFSEKMEKCEIELSILRANLSECENALENENVIDSHTY